MRAQLALRLAFLVLLPAGAAAQGNTTTGTGSASESRPGAGAVQIGAGSTAAVTTGSSGPESDSNPAREPRPPAFRIRPQGRSLFGPAALETQAPQALRCGVISDDAARRRCETRANEWGVPSRG